MVQYHFKPLITIMAHGIEQYNCTSTVNLYENYLGNIAWKNKIYILDRINIFWPLNNFFKSFLLIT